MPLSAPGKFKTKAINNSYGGNGSAENLTGDNAVIIGANSGKNISSSGVIVIGSEAGGNAPAINKDGLIIIGYNAAPTINGGEFSTIIGNKAASKVTLAAGLTCVGDSSALNITESIGASCFGYQAGLNINDSNENTAIGYRALRWPLTGVSGRRNTMIGANCASDTSLIAGGWTNNVGVGDFAMGGLGASGNMGATRCVAIGSSAIGYTNGSQDSVGVGFESLLNGAGQQNSALGSRSGRLITSTGTGNVTIGYESGANLRANLNGIFIGAGADPLSTLSHRSIIIGKTYLGSLIEDDSVMIGHLARPFAAGGDILVITNNNRVSDRPLISGHFSNGNVGIGNRYFGGGKGLLSLADATVLPTANNSIGGFLFVDNGALKWRGKAGTITTLALS